MAKYNLDNAKYLVFADFGCNGASIDLFEDEESARTFYGKLTKKHDDYESVFIGPIGEGAELLGEPSGLSQYFK